MVKSPTPPVFDFHVDGSCLTNSTDLRMPKQRDTSDETVVQNPPAEDADSVHPKDAAAEGEYADMDERSALLNERISAQIHEAARRVVADIERERYEEQEDSILSAQTDESYEAGQTELTYDGTEMTYDGTEATYESEQDDQPSTYERESELDAHIDQALTAWEPVNETPENDQDSSSHHDGDIDDDVFSEESGRSQRSSINSVHDLNSSDEAFQKALTSPAVREEAATSHSSQTISRIPSATSYVPDESNLHTPSKVLNRPPFRTPSSVRAMQLGSPTTSIFCSPRSSKRHMPTVSRIGTPNSQYSPSKRTPTRFKAKREPLILLHVAVMPLQWQYANAMTSREIPESLQHVKESWDLLQDKLANSVLERGILLSHPQDSYEVLEERLLEALELPVRPRAQILKCGHYMGPVDTDASSDEETTTDSYFKQTPGTDRKWCDICRKDVKLEQTGETCGMRRFNVKIFAGNGLMRAGAWAAAWRDMERVDAEIEPWVELGLRSELDDLALTIPAEKFVEEDDGFVDEEEIEVKNRALEGEDIHEQEHSAEEAEIRRKFEEEELAHKMREEEELRHKIEEEEMHRKLAEEEEEAQRVMDEETLRRSLAEEERLLDEENHRRKMIDEQRMREIYGPPPAHQPSQQPPHQPPTHSPNPHYQQVPRHVVDPDSLPELLLAAFKVLMRDKKNIAIGILSVLVLLLALRPATAMPIMEQPRVMMHDVTSHFPAEVVREVINSVPIAPIQVEVVREAPAKIVEVLQETVTEVPQVVAEDLPAPIVTQVTPEVVVEKPIPEVPALVVVEPELEIPVSPLVADVPSEVVLEDVEVLTDSEMTESEVSTEPVVVEDVQASHHLETKPEPENLPTDQETVLEESLEEESTIVENSADLAPELILLENAPESDTKLEPESHEISSHETITNTEEEILV